MSADHRPMLAFVLGLSLLVAGCASGVVSGSGPGRYDGPGAAPLSITEIWSLDPPDGGFESAELVGSSLVIIGKRDDPGEADSVVIDRDSGSVRWQASDLPREFRIDEGIARLRHLAGRPAASGSDGLLVLPYDLGACPDGGHRCAAGELEPHRNSGLVAFSLTDHSMVWHTEPHQDAAPPGPRLPVDPGMFDFAGFPGAADDVVVATVGVVGDEWSAEDSRRAQLSIGYDASTGEELWRRPGFVAHAVVDGVVTGLVESTRPAARGGVPVGADLRTGTDLWSMPPDTSATWQTAGAEQVMVLDHGAPAGDAPPVRLIRARDGTTHLLPDTDPSYDTWSLSDVPGGPLAWQARPGPGRNGTLVTLAEDGSLRVGANLLPPGEATTDAKVGVGFGPYAWVWHAGGGDGRYRAFDQTGAPRSPELTGLITVLSADLILVRKLNMTKMTLVRVAP